MAAIMRKVAIYALPVMLWALIGFPLTAKAQQDSGQQSTGDAVADAARKAREQKKKDAAKPRKVITDDDVNHLVSGAPSPTTEGTETGAEGAKTDAQGKKTEKPGEPEESEETKWRRRFKEAY